MLCRIKYNESSLCCFNSFYCRNNKHDSLFWTFYRNDTCFCNNLIFNYIKAIWVLIFIIILQQFDGWYLGPKILGNQVGLSPIWIIFAITIGGGTFGVMGMFLSVPIAAIIKIYLDKYIEMKLNKK